MPDNFFVDTNIWLYALMENNDIKQEKARSLIIEPNIIISTQVINEICYNLKKKTDYSENEMNQLIENLYNKYTVSVFTKSTLISASELRNTYSISFWDSLITATAIHSDCIILYSEDMQHGQVILDKLRIVNPFM